MSFAERLRRATDARGPLCIGIDPHASLLERWGLPATADGLARFADTCVAAFAGSVAVVKPQSAFFEVYGSAGIAVLERVVAQLRAAGVVVLLDVKRGDVGSTMAAYAQAYLDPSSALAVDAITVSPYLGVGSLQPVFELVTKYETGAFVLAFTSNPEGAQVQHARVASGALVGQDVVRSVADRGDPSLGLVVGATLTADADFAGFQGPILVPGIGAQGGAPADVRRLFGPVLRNVLPSTSREVLGAGPSVPALRDAADRAAESFAFLRA